MNDLISVVIPVYNVEKYLERCIDSVIGQTYKNIEIILVDDGSKDSSGNICDEYAKKDERIKVVHKENGGLSDARNVGVKHSKGKYISFIDSDDFIAPDYIEYLYKLIIDNKADISICRYDVVSENKINKYSFTPNSDKVLVLNNVDALRHLLLEDLYTVSACAKMYSKNVIEGIEFPLGKLYEDNGTVYKFFDNASNIAYGDTSKYVYLKRQDSITTKKMNEKNFDLIELTDEMCKYLSKYDALHDEIILKKISSRITIVNLILDNNKYMELLNEIILEIKNLSNQFNNKEIVPLKTKIAIFLIGKSKRIYKLFWNLYKIKKYGGII